MSAKDHVFTLGIEEEFQIIDPETRELRSHIQQILADGKMILPSARICWMCDRSSRVSGSIICNSSSMPSVKT